MRTPPAMITSTSNARIKQVRELQTSSRARREAQAFVVEGVRLVEEALFSGWRALWVIYTDDLNERGLSAVQAFTSSGAPVDLVSAAVMRAASDTETPQGLLAIIEWRPLPLPVDPGFIFIPDGVRDPGNLGTMLRTAAAAGVDAALIPSGNADPFAPKVLRAGMGAHFRLPIHSLEWEQITPIIQALPSYLADASSGQDYTEVDFRPPFALIIGGEAAGASLAAQQLGPRPVHIPMPGQTESLNAATAAAILMFEAVRQRRPG